MRTFTIEALYKNCRKLKFRGGRFISNTPYGAVKKSFASVQEHYGKKALKKYIIHLRETTQGSEHKIFKYHVKRIDEPIELKLNGTVVTFKYHTKVKSIN